MPKQKSLYPARTSRTLRDSIYTPARCEYPHNVLIKAFYKLPNFDQMVIDDNVTRLSNRIKGMGPKQSLELLACLGEFLNGGDRRPRRSELDRQDIEL